MTTRVQLSLAAHLEQFQQGVSSITITDDTRAELPVDEGVNRIIEMLIQNRQDGGRTFVIGNGGSAAIASHAVIDLLNCCKVAATVLHEPSTMTCMSNDFGYDRGFANPLAVMARAEDLLIAVSSSGNSMNIRAAAEVMREKEGRIITISGFKKDNPLRSLGDLNVHLDARDYGIVEVGHMFFLHHITDLLRNRT